MKTVSIHSHKGGVGKTTLGLLLCKYYARFLGKKTCFIDFDFQAPGLRGAYFAEYLKYDFTRFLLAEKK